MGEELAQCPRSTMLSVDRQYIIILISSNHDVSIATISCSYMTSYQISYQNKIYISQKGYHSHPPSQGGTNHKPKLVSYSSIVSIYEGNSVPTIYGILFQSNPTLCHRNLSMLYLKISQTSLQRASSSFLIASHPSNIILNLGHATDLSSRYHGKYHTKETLLCVHLINNNPNHHQHIHTIIYHRKNISDQKQIIPHNYLEGCSVSTLYV